MVIKVGLESVPCRVYPAVSDPPRVSFTSICRQHGAKLETLQRCSAGQEVVEKEAKAEKLQRAYEVGKGRFLPLTDAEIEELTPEPDPEIQVEAVVDVADLDPLLWSGKAQYLGAASELPVRDVAAERAYSTLVRALIEASEGGETAVAIGRWSTRGTDKLVAIRPMFVAEDRAYRLVVHELRRPGELRDAVEIAPGDPSDLPRLEAMAKVLRRLQLDKLDLEAFPDEKYGATVALLQAKAEAAADPPRKRKTAR